MVSQVVEGMGESPGPHLLRISINGNWSVSDFAHLFERLQQLYEIAQFGHSQSEHAFSFNLQRANLLLRQERRRWVYDPLLEAELDDEFSRVIVRNAIFQTLNEEVEQLQVDRISFASPGSMDVTGIGKAFEQVSKFILGVADRFIAREDRELAREEKRQDILAKKIKNIEKLANLADKIGLDAEARRKIIENGLETQKLIETKIIEGKITNVEKLE